MMRDGAGVDCRSWRRTVLLGSLVGGLLWIGATPAYGQGAASVPPALASAAAPLALRGVTVIDVRTGRHLPDRTVMISGTRIQALGRTGQVRVPRAAHVVDARGKYLIPGLWDMHVHPRGFEAIAYPLFIANGVTGIRDAASDTPLATLVEWKREIAVGTRVGPRMIVVGPAINEGDTDGVSTQTVKDQGHGFIDVPRSLLPHVVDSLKAAGADMLKMYSLSRQGFFTLAAAARRAGIRFGGHRPNGVSVIEASDSGATLLDHDEHPCWGFRDSLHGASCARAVRRFRQQGSWIVIAPASLALDTLAGQPRAAFDSWVRRRTRSYWHTAGFERTPAHTSTQAIVADSRIAVQEPTTTADWMESKAGLWFFGQYHADNVPLVVGSDLGVTMLNERLVPGFSTPEQLVALVLGGYTPLEALQAATLNPARALHATDSLGTVEAGKVADLVLLDADPLVDVWNTRLIRAVVANGRYFDRTRLNQLLAEVQAKVNQQP
jgi:hypothetical protein